MSATHTWSNSQDIICKECFRPYPKRHRALYKKYGYCYFCLPHRLRCHDKRCTQPKLLDEQYCQHHKNLMFDRRKKKKQGDIYVVSLGINNWYKIGRSLDAMKRLRTLKAGNPLMKMMFYEKVYDYNHVEKTCHDLMKNKNVEREVFKLSSKDLDTLHVHINK